MHMVGVMTRATVGPYNTRCIFVRVEIHNMNYFLIVSNN